MHNSERVASKKMFNHLVEKYAQKLWVFGPYHGISLSVFFFLAFCQKRPIIYQKSRVFIGLFQKSPMPGTVVETTAFLCLYLSLSLSFSVSIFVCHLSKEPSSLSKEPYILSQRAYRGIFLSLPFLLSNEPYSPSKEPYFPSKRTLSLCL